jgi:hypothetical protein
MQYGGGKSVRLYYCKYIKDPETSKMTGMIGKKLIEKYFIKDFSGKKNGPDFVKHEATSESSAWAESTQQTTIEHNTGIYYSFSSQNHRIHRPNGVYQFLVGETFIYRVLENQINALNGSTNSEHLKNAINVESVKKEMKDNEGTYSTLVLVIYENNYLLSDKAEIIAMWNVKS